MVEHLKIRLKPEEFTDTEIVKVLLQELVKTRFPVGEQELRDFRLRRRSIDARQKQIWIEAEYIVATGADTTPHTGYPVVTFRQLPPDAPTVVIVGAGPAGLFAALRAIESGWRPIVIERGKPVEERLHDVVRLQKEGELNPESNFCFGEGGAGTFSDGKLYTRSKKRGNVDEVLALLHQHGAREEIMYEAHPHIGSDRLPKIIIQIRKTILENGGEILFSTRMQRLIVEEGHVKGVVTSDGRTFRGPVILATGHSAHDVYRYLDSEGVRLEKKGFAMGVRLEHPQNLIDSIIYHRPKGRGEFLPPAEYKMVCQIEDRGVYSFCMCPGGVIVPSASADGENVVNGMSASGRSGRWANSGMVVEIRPEDFPEYDSLGNLGMLELQENMERRFFKESASLKAPAQRMMDFVEGKPSITLPPTSFVPGIYPADFHKLFPASIANRLKEGFKVFGRRFKGFLTNDAILIGLESRTSSPIRIPRDPETLNHPELPGLYPAGEGAGFAGGIVSSAIDGRRVMDAIASNFINDLTK